MQRFLSDDWRRLRGLDWIKLGKKRRRMMEILMDIRERKGSERES